MVFRELNNNDETSGLELRFVRAARWYGLYIGQEPWLREVLFCDGRKWRFDFAEPFSMVAVELHGGIHARRSRHTAAAGFQADREKVNHATSLGWRVLEFTEADVIKRLGATCALIKRTLARQESIR